ncbi:MAG TPA: DUF2298 domain-containing protein [Chloroflexota bacterium]|nr:DUF2298 domain-containing protein [Chloroflexota bacterium]
MTDFLRRRMTTRSFELLAVAALLLVALGLRLYGINWDDGHLYHPDERFILMSTTAVGVSWPLNFSQLFGPQSTLVPDGYSFSYGTFALYALRGVAVFLNAVGDFFGLTFLQIPNDPTALRIPGRILSALFDTATVYLVYWIGKRLFDRRIAYLGATLVAFSVLDIQLSHFYATDTLMTFFVVAAIAASVSVARGGGARPAIWAGVAVGLGLGTKFSAAPVLAPVVAAHLVQLGSTDRGPRLRWPAEEEINRALGLLILTGVTAVAVFLIVEPAAVFDFSKYVDGIFQQSEMVRRTVDLPYTRQYFGRPAYLYFLQNLLLFGVGVPLGLAMIGGLLAACWRNVVRPRAGELVLLAFVLPYFAITGDFGAKFMRYLLPITPLLALFAAASLIWLLDRARGGASWLPRLVAGAIVVVVGFSAFYSLAFDHMYDQTSSPVVGSEWLYQNAPNGSVLATEHWEEGMPVPLVVNGQASDAGSHDYQNVTMPMYDDDNPDKLNTIVQNLSHADYVVFFSNRLYGTVPRMPQRYPMSQRYYEELFSGKLGFTLVEVADRYPNLLGVAFVDDTLRDPGLPIPPAIQNERVAPITINLGHADESFSVYDHQKVLIFQKTQHLTPDQLAALIGPAPAPGATQVSPSPQPAYKSLLLTPAQAAVVQAGGTFSDLFHRGDWFNQFPLLTWIVLTALLGLAGVPLAFPIFRFLPDRGYLVGRTLAVLLLAWSSWIVVSLGLVEATRPEALVLFVALLGLSGLAAYRQRDALIAFVRERRALLAVEEAVFWLAFLYDVFIRSLNPDLWHPVLGGEKPMDLAFLTAAIKSPIYPPYDPWFSGGYMNYYYFGQITVGTLAKVSGIVPTTAYNLIVPLLFALTVAGAFTAGLALAHRGSGKPGNDALSAGLLASLMVCLLGNLGGFLQLLQGLAQLAPNPAGSDAGLPPSAVFAGLVQFLTFQRPLQIPQDWYWSSTRMIALLGEQGSGSINEFPYFTFLFADLHAHLIALPFTLLVLALAINVVKSGGLLAHRPPVSLGGSALGFALPAVLPGEVEPDESREQATSAVSHLATLGVTGLAVGMLYPTNTWDYPTYLGLLAVALLIPWYLSRRLTWGGLATVVVRLAVIALLSQLLYRPFYAAFQSFYSGVHLNDERSTPLWYVMINGLFLVILLSYLAVEAWRASRRNGTVRLLGLSLRKWEDLPRIYELRRQLVRFGDPAARAAFWVAAFLVMVVVVSGALGMSLTGLLIVLLVATLAIALRRDRPAEDCLLLMLFATGLAISVGVELVTIDGDVGRMNTVFKFYEQIWVLFGVGAAVALVRLKNLLACYVRPSLRQLWLGVIAAFFLMAAVYPVLGTMSRVANRFDPTIPPTLDGTAYMAHATYTDTDDQTGKSVQVQLASDEAAILWMQEHVSGTPTILEVQRPIYRWGSRFAIYTGLPAVIGWDWHEKQQRWGYAFMIDERVQDVARMYGDPSPQLTLALLQHYGVKYIILGQLEQGFYPQARAKFDAMVGTNLTLVYNQDGVRIYELK